jgi:uncharacterized protein YneF (UPF0154 family)
MNIGKSIKHGAAFTVVALLLLVLWGFWVNQRIESGESPFFFSEGSAVAVSITCTLLALLAIGGVVFIAIKAFYAGLKEPEPEVKSSDHGLP